MSDARVIDGFRSLARGVNGGLAPSLIGQDQCAAAQNITFRGAFPTTRPPFVSWPLTFDSATTEARFTGIFQGALQYDGEIGQSGWLVSIGGLLFFIASDTFIVSEVTPKLSIVTTADFVVPVVNGTVDVFVNSESAISTGDVVYIDSGTYLVTNRFTDELELKYTAPTGANATAKAGSGVLNSSQIQIFEYQPNPSTFDFVFMFQAENFAIILAGQHKTIIFDGSQARQASYNEIPPGVLGAYGWGRIWVCRPDRKTFIAGDIVGGPSGTAQAGFRDAILKVTENDFLNEGGAFSVPHNAGPITAMQFLATQDTSLGIGPLLVGTTNSVFSVNAPVDRTTWKNLTYPIQSVSLLDYGPQSPRAAVSVNGDMWYRSLDGIRSFIVARRSFGSWGNTPLSREVAKILDYDTKSQLFYGSGVFFDNKLYETVSPIRTGKGIEHRGMVTINYDLISNLQGKTSPAWEGTASGINILQFTKGLIDNAERAFAFVASTTGIELWELMTSGYYDERNTLSSGVITKAKQPIPAFLETRSQDYGDAMTLKSLHMAEIYLEDIVDTVNFVLKYRPDQYPCWIPWKTFSVCASVSQCDFPTPGEFSCSVIRMNEKLYAARITIPQPPDDCNAVAGGLMREGREFQQRLEWTGHCRIRTFRTHAKLKTQPMEGQCPPIVQCKALTSCCDQIFSSTGSETGGDSSGGGGDDGGGSGGGGAFLNTRQCFEATCPAGTTGTPVTVCIEAADPRYSSNVSQVDADAQALAAATEQANAALVCVAACAPGLAFDAPNSRCIPVCRDLTGAPNGYMWNGAEFVPVTAGNVGYFPYQDLVTKSCAIDFTGISGLFGSLLVKEFAFPHGSGDPFPWNCDLPMVGSDQRNIVQGNPAYDPVPFVNFEGAVHPERVYGAGVDPNRVYTVTIRVRGVFELKHYLNPDGSFNGLVTGHADPDQPYVFVVDPFNVDSPPAGWIDPTTGAMSGGGENEYWFAIDDTSGTVPGFEGLNIEYRFLINGAHAENPGGNNPAHDFTFKVQVKSGQRVVLLGTSVDNKEFPNPTTPGGTVVSVGGEPILIKAPQPYPGQFIQLDVIAIDYNP